MIGESPSRPGSFQAKPLVVVQPDISPRRAERRAMNRPSRRKQHLVHGRGARLGAHAELRGQRQQAVVVAIGLARLRRAGAAAPSSWIGEPGPHQSACDSFHSSQTLRDSSVSRSSRLKPRAKREALRALAHQHHVAGVQHDLARQSRDAADVAHAADRAGAARGAVHAAGVELDHALLVRQAAEADAVVVRVVLRARDHRDHRSRACRLRRRSACTRARGRESRSRRRR